MRVIARFWRSVSASSWRGLPTPSGLPLVRASGPHPDRLLLFGGGIAVGYGALSQELALGGQLAKRVSALTGRGVTLQVHARADFEIPHASSLLQGIDLTRFDAIVATFGGAEAATLLAAKDWRTGLDSLLDRISRLSPRTHTFVVAVPPIAGIPGFWGKLARRQTLRFNEQSRAACEHRVTVTFLPYVALDLKLQEMMNAKTYQAWGALLAAQLIPALDDLARTPKPADQPDELARQAALERLGVRRAAPDRDLGRLVTTVKDLFHASGASVNLIDDERQWSMANVGMPTPEIPRQESFCDYTIRTAELFVVPDTLKDPRFANLPWATGEPPIRFYAGYPLESPDGQRIGALCIVDTKPRSFSPLEAKLLQDLALRAQTLLWGAATQVATAST